MKFVHLEDLAYLSVLDFNKPVYHNWDVYSLLYAEPGFAIGAPKDINMLIDTEHTIVCTLKKEVTQLKKLDLTVEEITPSDADILKSMSGLASLSRRAYAISNLKNTAHKIAAAAQIALLGENKTADIIAQFPEGNNFTIQEDFLSMNIGNCLDRIRKLAPTQVVEVGMLLLSGHTTAFAIKEAGFQAAVDNGINAYYAGKIRDLSTTYTRKVNFVKATEYLSGLLGWVKEGQEPLPLLRRVVLNCLA